MSSVARNTLSGICVFSMKLMRSVVSFCESKKLDRRSVGPPLPETICLPTWCCLINFSQRVKFWYTWLFKTDC